MTLLETIKGRLVSNGMFEKQADEVMKLAIPELQNLVEGYSLSLDRPASEYSKIMTDILYASVKPIALGWIEENTPQAWFKPVFQ